MIPSNAALAVAYWERLRERLLGQQPGEGRGRLLEQRSVEQPGYLGGLLLRLHHHRARITVIPTTGTQRTDRPLSDIQPMAIPPTHSRAIAIHPTRAPQPMVTLAAPDTPPTQVPRPMDTPAALDTRPTRVHPAMKRRV